MTLFRNFAVLRQHKGNPFAPIQILTGDIRKGCHTRCSRLLDERRSFLRKSCIERRFESSPESRGSQTSGVLPVLFVQAKRIKPFPFREVPRFCEPRISTPNNTLPLTKLNPFSKKESRFCKPRFSSSQAIAQRKPRVKALGFLLIAPSAPVH